MLLYCYPSRMSRAFYDIFFYLKNTQADILRGTQMRLKVEYRHTWILEVSRPT